MIKAPFVISERPYYTSHGTRKLKAEARSVRCFNWIYIRPMFSKEGRKAKGRPAICLSRYCLGRASPVPFIVPFIHPSGPIERERERGTHPTPNPDSDSVNWIDCCRPDPLLKQLAKILVPRVLPSLFCVAVATELPVPAAGRWISQISRF